MQNGSFKNELLETQSYKWVSKMMQSLDNPTTTKIRLEKTLTIKPEIII
jgi:hypothetical protein